MKKTMLIVDDIEMNRVIMENYFCDEFETVNACDGVEALGILRSQKIDVVLTDIFMPEMDGCELIETMRADAGLADIAVIAITERGEEHEIRALQSGADDFINKPLSRELLQHRVKAVMSRDRARMTDAQNQLAFNKIGLPFAIISPARDENGRIRALKYHYVNEAYARVFGNARAFVMSSDILIALPGFVDFISKLPADGHMVCSTFRCTENRRYYNVNAYRENDDFYGLSISANNEIMLRRYQDEQYQHIMHELMAANPNTLGAVHINISQNVCERGVGSSAFIGSHNFPMPLDALISELHGFAANDASEEALQKFLDVKNMLHEFETGHDRKTLEMPCRMIAGGIHWITVYLRMTVQPYTQDVEGVLYCVDDNDSKLSNEVIETVVRKEYDTLFYVDLVHDEARIFSGGSEAYWNGPFALGDMDTYIQQYLRERYVGENVEQFLKDNTIPAIAAKMQNMESYTVEYRIREGEGDVRLKRGTYYWLDDIKQNLCFTRADITDSFTREQQRSAWLEKALEQAREDERNKEKQHYEELHQKNMMVDNLIKNVPGGIAVYKVVGDGVETMYYSDGVPRLTGRTAAEYDEIIKGDVINDAVVAEDRERLRAEIAAKAPRGLPLQVTYRLMRKGGGTVTLLLSAEKIREENGCPVYYTIFSTVPEQVMQYSELCENTPTAVYVQDTDTHELLYMNGAMQKLTRRSDDYAGKKCYEYIMNSDRICDFCPLGMNKAPDSEYYEQSIEFSEQNLAVSMRSKAVIWNGKPAYITYMSDETYRIRALEEEAKLKKAEEANIAKNDFLARMSHDLRTPLNAIIGFSSEEVLADATAQQQREYFEKINTSSQYLLSLINDILDMSKIENGKLSISLHPVKVKRLYDEVDTVIRPQAEKNGLEFIVLKSELLGGYIVTDRMRLEQVFMNLLSNAIKFTPRGGTVIYRARLLKREGANALMEFMIKDTGIGMSPEFMEHAFEAFAQEHRMDNSGAGTGLGLSIVKNLVEMLKGTITVSSEINRGTTFMLRMPFEYSQDEADEQEHIHDEKLWSDTLAGRRVLLCEDHPLNRQIAELLLHHKKMEVEMAENGRIAVEKFAASAPGYYDAVLMDIRMPEMDGLEAARRIRALDRPDAAVVPVIAMTANAFDDDVAKSLAAGMNAHLAKPINSDQLYGTLSENIIAHNAGFAALQHRSPK